MDRKALFACPLFSSFCLVVRNRLLSPKFCSPFAIWSVLSSQSVIHFPRTFDFSFWLHLFAVRPAPARLARECTAECLLSSNRHSSRRFLSFFRLRFSVASRLVSPHLSSSQIPNRSTLTVYYFVYFSLLSSILLSCLISMCSLYMYVVCKYQLF